jgi:hypothetical protein
VARLFLAVWLAAFALQSANVLALVVPDDCTEEVSGTEADPCPDACPRCFCCARGPAFVPQVAPASVPQVVLHGPTPFLAPATTPSPHGIYHVPKNSLT